MNQIKIISVLMLLSFCLVSSAFADYVSGYTRRDGKYVSGYHRSDPNDTVRDNYSYKNNVNPYTSEVGSNKYKSSPTSEYYDYSSSRKSPSYL